jgi:peptide/nickel transport system permease protein
MKNIILPAFTLGLRPLAMVAQMTRAAMLDVLGADYIRTARAKGMLKPRIFYVHALRNAMNPVLTGISGWGAELLAGAYFVEFIFGWQGLGKLTVESLDKLDWPLLNGAILWSACIFILAQWVTDWLQGKLDPRI